MSFNHSSYLESEYVEDILPDLGLEVSGWSQPYRDIFNRRDNLVRMIFGGESTDEELVLGVDSVLTVCGNTLSDVKMTSKLPPDVKKERNEYKELLLDSIDSARKVYYNYPPKILRDVEEVVSGVLDYYYSLNKGYQILKANVDWSYVEEEKLKTIKGNSSYYADFERDRAIRRWSPSVDTIDKVVGKGKKLRGYPTAGLISGLFEYVQPKEQLLNIPEAEIEEMRVIIERELGSYVNIRSKLRKKLQNKLNIRRVLLEKEEAVDMLLSEIRPRTPYDLISGHPVQQKLRVMIRQDEELLDRVDKVIESYMVSIPGRHCSQAVIYDMFYDVLLGQPEQVLWFFNLYQTKWGYPPLPGYESLTPEDVINPVPEEKFDLRSIVPQLTRYDASAPMSDSIA